jgi:hypothetical protein
MSFTDKLPIKVMTILLMWALVMFHSICALSELSPTKTAILKCVSYRADGSMSGVETWTMNVKVDFIRLTLWIGVINYQIISLSKKAILVMEQLEDGADIIIINRDNGAFERSSIFANVYGAHYMSWSGSCSPTPI